MPVTIKDVAAAVGVSASTVSRALSRPEKVDEDTRRRILETAESLGYRVNRAARTLNTGRTGCIGAVLPDLENPFFAGVLKGIEQAADDLGYQTLVADTGESVPAEQRAISALAPQVDGLLMCSSRLEDDEIRRINDQRPVVLINRSVGDVPHVSFDNEAGMQEAMRHLLALGHRRIGYVGGNLTSRSARERLHYFRHACERAGRSVQGTVLGEFPPTFEGGGAAADVALNAPVTAVVVYNDVMAIGLTHRLLSYGLRLPDRLSVLGFDNVPIAAMVTPPLTTVDLPRIEAGRLAAGVLSAVLDGSPSSPGATVDTHLFLPARLVVRRSTAVLQAAASSASSEDGQESTPGMMLAGGQ